MPRPIVIALAASILASTAAYAAPYDDAFAAYQKGDYATALKLQDKLTPLHINLFVETSPAPIKYAMSLIGKCANTVRLPMVPASEKAEAAVREAMVHAGLIN